MPYPALRVRSPVESSPSRTVDVPSAMVALIVTLLFFTVLIEGEATENATQVNNHAVSPSQCLHWGEWKEPTDVQDGEVGWLHCPLFRQVYSYSSMQASGLTLLWYRTTDGQLQEEPVTCKHKNCSKDREWLWLEPATLQDSGKYTCMLSNNTYCTSITMRLEVIPRGDGTFKEDRRCPEQLAVASREMRIPIQSYKEVPCPDIDMLQHRSLSYTTAWYHKCRTEMGGYANMKVEKNEMKIFNMLVVYGGNYTCVVSYDKAGQSVNFTRVVHIVPVSNDRVSKNPIILNPAEKQNYTVKQGETAVLTCKATLPYLEKPEEKQSDWFEGHVEKQEVWWTVDGKTVAELAAQGDSRFNETSRVLESELGDETREVVLRIQGFTQEDLSKEYNCTARNSRGNDTRRAVLLEEEVNLYVELSCGLGVIMVIMLTIFVIYHVYWMEILLFYRYHFGSDERSTDDKEYDVYISYARQSEEEEFVIKTLRRVLENELGYTVCIFDRDSLPGGTITDETLLFVNRCRRQIVVVSPKGEVLGTQAMLELRAGLDRMVSGGGLRVILVQYKPIPGDKWVRELRRTRGVLALVRWEGERSQDLSSRFWKRLQVELPVRRVNGSSQLKEVTTEESKVPLKSIETIKSPGS